MAAKEISVKKYVVRLSGEERERLETLIRKGKEPGATGPESADLVESRRLGWPQSPAPGRTLRMALHSETR